MEKQCFKCLKVLPLECFYKHPQMADGRLNKCKECNKKDVRNNRKDKIDYYRNYDLERGSRTKYWQTREYGETYPNKYKATTALNNAIRDKKLFKKPCEVCGHIENVHGHHDDYLKPLTVRWLCPIHHREWHDENGEALNAT